MAGPFFCPDYTGVIGVSLDISEWVVKRLEREVDATRRQSTAMPASRSRARSSPNCGSYFFQRFMAVR